MSEPVTQVSVPEVVEKEWRRLGRSMPFRMEGGEIVGSLRLAFLAGAWIGHANHGAIEQHHRKPQPDKPPANESACETAFDVAMEALRELHRLQGLHAVEA